jgi:hypothetical protein
MREQIESLGMQVDGAHESMEMTLTDPDGVHGECSWKVRSDG